MKIPRYVVPYTSMYHLVVTKYRGGYPQSGLCIFLGKTYHFRRVGDSHHRVSFFELYRATFTEDCVYRLYLTASISKEYVGGQFKKHVLDRFKKGVCRRYSIEKEFTYQLTVSLHCSKKQLRSSSLELFTM